MSTAALAREARRLRAALQERTPAGVPDTPTSLAAEVGLELDDWQEDVLRSEHPRIILNISRQGGKSTMAGILTMHRALTVPESLVLILAPSERQAKETFAKAAALYRHDIPTDSYRKLGLELRNGSRIEALPGTEKTVRCYSGVDLLILDEAARVDDELYYAVKPMLAVSGGRLLMMSTPWGKRGIFWETWESAEGWERFEVDAYQIPRIPQAFLEEERASMPEGLFAQEYLCQFTETTDEIFTADMVAGAVTDEVVPLDLGDEW